MVVIAKYGPVLDLAIDVVKELARYGSAEVRVPVHPEAAGMAHDLRHMFWLLDPEIRTDIYSPDSRDRLVKVRTIRFVFEHKPFEVPDQKEFSSYPPGTNLVQKKDKAIVYVAATEMGRYHRARVSARFLEKLNNCVELPNRHPLIKLSLRYRSITETPVDTFFQSFLEAGKTRAHGHRTYYPVSETGIHYLEPDVWDFFGRPVWWDSMSQRAALSIKHMTGARSYEQSAEEGGLALGYILSDAPEAEQIVVGLLRAQKERRNIDDVANEAGCPPQYRHFLLSRVLRTLSWHCNPDGLHNPEKLSHLHNLSAACAERGLKISPNELAQFGEKPKPAGP